MLRWSIFTYIIIIFPWGRGYTTDYSFVWVGLFAWGIGSAILNMGVLAAALTFLSPNKTPATAPAVEASAPPLENGTAPKSAVTAINGGKSVQSVDTATSSAIPFTPMVMTFQDLKYSVVIQGSGSTMDAKSGTDTADPHAGQLLLLKGITGSFRPGVLTALMGSSGAGKTTLLDVLAGRKTGGTITGDVRVNGHPKDQATFARVSGYVEQDDIHGPFATVHEALQFSARLRLPSDVPAAKVEAFVAEIMDLVELTTIKASLVGSPGVNGLSVEQRKRLTLAVELVANPAIVFMDEPTSGLDARAAAVVMRAARNVVATGRTVVCTIHQPSHAIFSSFMELLLLKRGGETIFFGELGPGAANLVAYLEGLPGVTPIEPK